jgi:hypothetical protein
MNVTLDQAIEIHARAAYKRFGVNARVRTQERIDHLKRVGDVEGARVHERVREHIAALKRNQGVAELSA